MFSWFSCEKFSKDCCRSLDEDMSLWDSARVKFHYFICLYCRRFSRHVHQMEEQFKDAESFEDTQSSFRLSPNASEKIRDKVNEALSE